MSGIERLPVTVIGAGAKSCGRTPTLLLTIGHEQARTVVAALASDWGAARNVRLELPGTGACSSNLAFDDAEQASGCCGSAPAAEPSEVKRGLATSVSGSLLSLPPVEVGAETSGGSCCG